MRWLPADCCSMRGQSMTSLAAASHCRARPLHQRQPTARPDRAEQAPRCFSSLMAERKAWEMSRDPRPSLRTAEYCLHGNEGNKTTQGTLLSPAPQVRTHKSGGMIGRSGAGQQRMARKLPAVPQLLGAICLQDPLRFLGLSISWSTSLVPTCQSHALRLS